MVEQGHLKPALECLKDVLALAPSEEYILRHMKIVESRIRSSENENQKNGKTENSNEIPRSQTSRSP